MKNVITPEKQDKLKESSISKIMYKAVTSAGVKIQEFNAYTASIEFTNHKILFFIEKDTFSRIIICPSNDESFVIQELSNSVGS